MDDRCGRHRALLHDFIVTLGVYWLLGFRFTRHDHRIAHYRRSPLRHGGGDLWQSSREYLGSAAANWLTCREANLAINQTLIRSLNTSITGLLRSVAVLIIGVWWLGADTLRDLSLVMFVGMLLSAISSISSQRHLPIAWQNVTPRLRLTPSVSWIVVVNTSESETEITQPGHGFRPPDDRRASGGHRGQGAQPKRREE